MQNIGVFFLQCVSGRAAGADDDSELNDIFVENLGSLIAGADEDFVSFSLISIFIIFLSLNLCTNIRLDS